MNYYFICFALSIITFVTGLAYIFTNKRNCHLRQIIFYLLALTASAIFPLYFVDYLYNAHGGLPNALFLTTHEVIRTFLGDGDVLSTERFLHFLPQALQSYAAVYISFLHTFGLSLILGIFLTLLQGLVAFLRYNFMSSGELCVFSGISERALLLAEDIQRQKKNKVVVFLNSHYDDENIKAHWNKILKNNIIVLDKELCELTINRRFKNKEVHFFLLNDDEEKNVHDMLELAKHYESKKDIKLINIYTLSNQSETEAIVDSIPREAAHIRYTIIRENRSAFYELFSQKPLFLGAKHACSPRENNNLDLLEIPKSQRNTLKILILGAGQLGMEALIIASWCGQTSYTIPVIIVVDKDENAQKKFEYHCPECIGKNLNPLSLEESTIKFITCDVETSSFLEEIQNYPDIGYVICTLGNDNLNLRVALKIRAYFEELFIKLPHEKFGKNVFTDLRLPIINVHQNDATRSEYVKNMSISSGNKAYLNPFGDLKSLYTWKVCVSPYFNAMGKVVNRAWSTNEKMTNMDEIAEKADISYYASEYNRTSSIASGLHTKYKFYSCLQERCGKLYTCEDWDWGESLNGDTMNNRDKILLAYNEILENDKNAISNLSMLEHRRWNMYTRSIGIKYASYEEMKVWWKNEELLHYYGGLQKKAKNEVAKLHANLISWNELKDFDMKFNFDKLLTIPGSTIEDNQGKDRKIIENLTKMVREAGNIKD